MNDDNAHQEQLPEPAVETRPRLRLSLIWVVPLIAALVALSLIVKHYVETGPSITIEFNDAQGLTAGKTEVKYKDVIIGEVSNIKISQNYNHVLVHVTLKSEAARFASKDTRYWVVRPRVGIWGVSGLGTLLSGSYIGADIGKSKQTKHHFKGLENPPALTHNSSGSTYTLMVSNLKSLHIGSPVYYRGVKVGRIVDSDLNDKGTSVTMRIFVESPYDDFVRRNTRFWNASGLHFSMGPNGLKVNTGSMLMVLLGGIAFQSQPHAPVHGKAHSGATFTLYENKNKAMKTALGPAFTLRMKFSQTLRGLSTGAPVLFRGVKFGRVESVHLGYDPETHDFPQIVKAEVHPMRLGRIYTHIQQLDQQSGKKFLQILVKKGLRARAPKSSLFTGARYISLDFVSNASPVDFHPGVHPVDIPTAGSSLSQIKVRIADILKKVDALPLKEMSDNINTTIKRTNQTLKHLNGQLLPQVENDLKAMKTTLETLNSGLSESSPLRRNLSDTLNQINRAAQSLKTLGNYLSRNPQSVIMGKPGDPSSEYQGNLQEPKQ